MAFLIEYKIFIFSFFAIVVFALAIYLGVIFGQLKKQGEEKRRLQEKLDEKIAEQDTYFKESIVFICKATIQGQCEISEACIRIKKLLEYYPDIESIEDFNVIQQLYTGIKDFATHSDRKELSKQEVFNQDKKRMKIEKDFETEFLNILPQLQEQIERKI